MIIIYILVYIAIGLIVARVFQTWADKDAYVPTVDFRTFICTIIIWPIALLILCLAGFICAGDWFFRLGKKK